MLKIKIKTKIGFFNAVYMIPKFEVELFNLLCLVDIYALIRSNSTLYSLFMLKIYNSSAKNNTRCSKIVNKWCFSFGQVPVVISVCAIVKNYAYEASYRFIVGQRLLGSKHDIQMK